MDLSGLNDWVSGAPLAILGGIVIFFMVTAAMSGAVLRARRTRMLPDGADGADDHESFLLSSVLGMLALLMGFTFALAVDRFDTRRVLVLTEANAIGTTYLRTQLLEEPHRSRITGLLVEYTDNRVALAKGPPAANRPLLAKNDRLIVDLWAATSAAFPTIKGLDFSTAYLDTMNNLIDLDASRKAARLAHVPGTVFVVLAIYLIVTSGLLGYVLTGFRGRATASFMLLLLALLLLLILDIDSPVRGTIRELQGPMERLDVFLKTQPPATFDKWRKAPPR